MSIRIEYTLSVYVPDYELIDRETHEAIAEAAEPHDEEWSEKVMRYLGDFVSDAEDAIGESLSPGWSVTLAEARAYV